MNRTFKLLLVFLFLPLLTSSHAQEKSDYYNSAISELFGKIAESENDDLRERLSDSLVMIVELYLAEDLPLNSRIEGGRYLGQIYAADSLLKLISWNIAFRDGSNRYTAFIVRKSESGVDFWKVDSRTGINMLEQDSSLGYHDWYGALYYDIRPFVSGARKYYLLLGLDMNGLFTHGKVVDILSFNKENEPVFGAPLILFGNTIQHRVIFKYSAQVSMLLRFDADSDRVVFDHLSPADPRFTGVYQYYGPDFSYDALEFRNGLWRLSQDIDLRNREYE